MGATSMFLPRSAGSSTTSTSSGRFQGRPVVLRRAMAGVVLVDSRATKLAKVVYPAFLASFWHWASAARMPPPGVNGVDDEKMRRAFATAAGAIAAAVSLRKQ